MQIDTSKTEKQELDFAFAMNGRRYDEPGMEVVYIRAGKPRLKLEHVLGKERS
jgi:hypothetical protein